MTIGTKVFVSQRSAGFTIIELVVVIIILGIMSATIVPRFLTSSGFEEYSYRSQIITTLRTVQLRAMQQTQRAECHTIKIGNKRLGLLDTDNSADTCNEGAWFDEKDGKYDLDIEDGPTSVSVDNNHGITFSGSDFTFDQMGRPLNCSNPCVVSIDGGEQLLTIKIEPEGYIHASN